VLGEWNPRNVDGVKILNRVHILLTPTLIDAVFHDGIRTLTGDLLTRDPVEDLIVHVVNITVTCREYGAISEVLIILRLRDARVDLLDERVHSVLRAFEMIRQANVPIGLCVSAMSHIQKPLCIVSLSWVISQTHILSQLEDDDVLPDWRVTKT
jgi:hypothetical protein